MKKSVYLALICVVTVCCIIGGTIYHVGGWVWNDWVDWFDWGRDDSGNSGKAVTDSGDEALEAFTGLSVDADIADLTIQTGSDYHISWKVKRAGAVEYSVNNGTLEVTQRQPKRLRQNIDVDIIITVPTGANLQSADLHLAVGDLDMTDVSIDTLEINADVGEVDLEDVELGNAVISASVGDVDMERCTFGNLEVNADVGEITVEATHSLEDYTFDLSSDIGGVKVNGRIQKGGYQKQGSGSYHITLEADVGEIELTY